MCKWTVRSAVGLIADIYSTKHVACRGPNKLLKLKVRVEVLALVR